MISFDPILRQEVTYNYGPTSDSIINGIGKEINKVKDAVEKFYPRNDRYSHYYDSAGVVEKQVQVIDRITEFAKDFHTNLISFQNNVDYNLDNISSALYSINYDINNGLNKIIDGISSLQSDFRYYMGLSISIMQSIDYSLHHPRKTSAWELREDGIECVKHGWIEEAVRKLEESKKIYDIDFITYKQLGHIYFQEKTVLDFNMALENFLYAARYSKPFSKNISGECLYFAGASYAGLGQINEAINSTKDSLELTPDNSEALYQLASLYAVKGLSETSIRYLNNAIVHNKGFFRRVMSDDSFETIRSQVNGYLNGLINLYREKSKNITVQAESSLQDMKSWNASVNAQHSYKNAEKAYVKGKEYLIQARDIIDYNRALLYLQLAVNNSTKSISIHKHQLMAELEKRERQIGKKLKEAEKHNSEELKKVKEILSKLDEI